MRRMLVWMIVLGMFPFTVFAQDIYPQSYPYTWSNANWANTTVTLTGDKTIGPLLEVNTTAQFGRLYLKPPYAYHSSADPKAQTVTLSIRLGKGMSDEDLYLSFYSKENVPFQQIKLALFRKTPIMRAGFNEYHVPMSALESIDKTIGGIVIELEKPGKFEVRSLGISEAEDAYLMAPPKPPEPRCKTIRRWIGYTWFSRTICTPQE